MIQFGRLYFSILGFILIAGYTTFVFSNLTSYPGLWLDEGFKMQLARNFAETGKVVIQFEPGQFEYSVHNASTGWPVAVSLGLFFKIFGVSFATARTFAALVLVAFLIAVWFLVKNKWGNGVALGAIALLTTYAPLYVNGKMVLAELPGLLFLALGFLFLGSEVGPQRGGPTSGKFIIPSIFFGLFVATKLSFVATFLPALVLGHIWALYKRQVNWRELVLPWITIVLLVVPTIFMSLSSNLSGAELANPYGQASFLSGVLSNLKLFLTHSTLWHLLLLALVVSWQVLAEWRKGNQNWLIVTLTSYGLLVVSYWLLSPAVFRYLLPLALMLLILLPVVLLETSFSRKTGFLLIALLIIAQGYHFATSASISHGSDYLKFEQYMRDNPFESGKSVGIINSAFAPVLVPLDNMFQFVRIDAITEGKHPLANPDNLPDYLIYEIDNFDKDIVPYLPILEARYRKKADFEQVFIWQQIEEDT